MFIMRIIGVESWRVLEMMERPKCQISKFKIALFTSFYVHKNCSLSSFHLKVFENNAKILIVLSIMQNVCIHFL